MKKILCLAMLIMIAGCKKEPKQEHVKGDVLTGIKSEVTIDSMFAVFNRLGLEIKEVSSYTYAVPFPEDKLDSVAAYLNTKPYIDTANWKARISVHARWNRPVYFSHFFNMNEANQQDLLRTITDLGLIDLHDEFTTVYLRVPEGTEQHWVDVLSKNSIIRWAELNNIVHIDPR